MTKRSANPSGRLVIGTRGSPLAVAQSTMIADAIRACHPNLTVSLARITTGGDLSQGIDRPISAVGTKGLFTAELESALADGAIDLAVHSSKDLPTALADGTDLLAWPIRGDPRDALVIGPEALAPGSLASLPGGAVVGTSSLRRAGQLLALRPDLKVEPIRGNVQTRIEKVRSGAFAATLLAVAGLRRLSLLHEAAEVMDVRQIVPAAGQGALALQGRCDDARVRELLAPLHHEPTARAVTAERHVVARLAGGCNMPLGVYVRQHGGGRLEGIAALVGPTGRPRVTATAVADDPTVVAEGLVEQLLAAGGSALLGAD